LGYQSIGDHPARHSIAFSSFPSVEIAIRIFGHVLQREISSVAIFEAMIPAGLLASPSFVEALKAQMF